MKVHTYEYAVLRYVHDPISQESLNIGVLIYSKESKFLELMVTPLYSRLSEAFAGFDGVAYRSIVQHLNSKATDAKSRLFSGDWTFSPPDQIVDVLPSILIPNDSSFMFCNIGTGITPSLTDTLQSLYARLVTRYTKSDEDSAARDDETVWKVFASALAERKVLEELHPRVIETPTFAFEFEYAWRNEKWHPLQPLSLDLQAANSIHQKANRWIGNLTLLRKNQDLGTVYFLIGRSNSPSDIVQKAYSDAVVNMRTIENVEIYEEDHADEFARRLASKIAHHQHNVGHS